MGGGSFWVSCDPSTFKEFVLLEAASGLSSSLCSVMFDLTIIFFYISMDFIIGLPQSQGKEVIFVVVDRLTKYGYFMELGHPYSAEQVAEIFMDSVYKLHGCPSTIVSDRDFVFLSNF